MRPPLTHAVVSSVNLHVLGRTHTGVVAQGVVAGSRSTDADVSCALVDVCTGGKRESRKRLKTFYIRGLEGRPVVTSL